MNQKYFIRIKFGEEYHYINLAHLISAEFRPAGKGETAQLTLHMIDGDEQTLDSGWAELVHSCLQELTVASIEAKEGKQVQTRQKKKS